MAAKDILALVGVIITIFAALPYIRDTLKKKTKPSVITWLIWTVLASSGCVLQIIGDGGWGSAVLGVTAFFNLIILVLALNNTKDHIKSFDIMILGLAALSFALWRITSSAELAAILVTFTMALGYIPTYKKCLTAPQNETLSLFMWSGIKQIIGIAALSAYNILTLLFPVFLVFANFGLVALIVARKKQLKLDSA